MTIMWIIWCVFLIPLVSILDGGFLGWVFSLGSPRGAVAGILITAAILYGQVIYLLTHA